MIYATLQIITSYTKKTITKKLLRDYPNSLISNLYQQQKKRKLFYNNILKIHFLTWPSPSIGA